MSSTQSTPITSSPTKIDQITVLIPFFNEEKYLTKTVESLVQDFPQIILINDGSTDQSSALISQRFPQLTLINLPTNSGKSAATEAGLEQVSTPYVLTVDSDAVNLDVAKIKAGCRLLNTIPPTKRTSSTTNHLPVQLVIFFNQRHDIANRLDKTDFLSGCRALSTALFREVFAQHQFHGYQLEQTINLHFIKNKYRAVCVQTENYFASKIEKEGLLSGIKNDLKMTGQVVRGTRRGHGLRSFTLPYLQLNRNFELIRVES